MLCVQLDLSFCVCERRLEKSSVIHVALETQQGSFSTPINAHIPVTNSVKGAAAHWKYTSDAPTHTPFFGLLEMEKKRKGESGSTREEPSGGGIAAKTMQTGKPMPSASGVGARLPQTPTDIRLHSSAFSLQTKAEAPVCNVFPSPLAVLCKHEERLLDRPL